MRARAFSTLGSTGLAPVPLPEEPVDAAVRGFISAHAARAGVSFEVAKAQLLALAPLENRDHYRKALERMKAR